MIEIIAKYIRTPKLLPRSCQNWPYSSQQPITGWEIIIDNYKLVETISS